MDFLRHIAITITLAMSVLLAGAETISLHPGDLPGLVKTRGDSFPVELRLQGEATSEDLASLRYLPASVAVLDMSGLTVSDKLIPPYALFATGIKTVVLPESITGIGEAAFAETPIESINFPASLAELGARAFYRCRNLSEVNLSETSLIEIPEQCFFGTSSLERVSFPACLTAVGNKAFMKSGVPALDIRGVSNVGDYAFAEMPALGEISIKDGVKLGEGSFFNNGVLTKIAGAPSNDAPLSLANNKVKHRAASVRGTVVGEGAYAGIEADTIIISSSVKEIGEHAFRNAKNLKAVNVVKCGRDVPLLSPEAFSGVDTGGVSLVTSYGDEDVWKRAPVWQLFNIREGSGVEDASAADVLIDVSRPDDGSVNVKSNNEIDRVEVYSLDGRLLYQSCPSAMEHTAGPFLEDVVVVRADACGVSKILKLIK